jgi:predicted metalloprotease with PDZ domain
LQERLEQQKFIFIDPDGSQHIGTGDFEFDIENFSGFADQAFADADVFFGLSTTRGLEFATVNEDLGAYFKTERGVLVLRAAEDNAYQLQAGDVILAVDGEAVDTPAELLRVLRRAEPGTELRLDIKRDRRSRTLDVTMPENRLGQR